MVAEPTSIQGVLAQCPCSRAISATLASASWFRHTPNVLLRMREGAFESTMARTNIIPPPKQASPTTSNQAQDGQAPPMPKQWYAPPTAATRMRIPANWAKSARRTAELYWGRSQRATKAWQRAPIMPARRIPTKCNYGIQSPSALKARGCQPISYQSITSL